MLSTFLVQLCSFYYLVYITVSVFAIIICDSLNTARVKSNIPKHNGELPGQRQEYESTIELHTQYATRRDWTISRLVLNQTKNLICYSAVADRGVSTGLNKPWEERAQSKTTSQSPLHTTFFNLSIAV